MRNIRSGSRQHKVDILFPLALLFVFLLSAMTVVLLASHVYGRIAAKSAQAIPARTAAAYLTERLHQNDCSGCVTVTSAEGIPLLMLEPARDSAGYCTYIYQYDGFLRELMVRKDDSPKLDRGQKILPLEAFAVTQVQPHLFAFTCQDRKSNTATVYVGITSDEG